MECIFCKIIEGQIPSKKIYEGDKVIGFVDLHPQAKTHLLFVHKEHSTDVGFMAVRSPNTIGEVYASIHEHAHKTGLADSGYRVVVNTGKDAGQTVFHTHFHVLGGEKLGHFGS